MYPVKPVPGGPVGPVEPVSPVEPIGPVGPVAPGVIANVVYKKVGSVRLLKYTFTLLFPGCD